MRRLDKGFLYAACGLFALSFPSTILAQGGQQTAGDQATSSIALASQTNQSAAAPAVGETASAALPDSPGAVLAQEQNPSSSSAAQSAATPSPQLEGQSPANSSSQQTQEAKPQRPVGTAAAEAPMVSGVTAAQPAGVAIAPAKQRRVRTIVLKMGAIVGAGVALGTTIALTRGTPSKPPGAH